MFVCSKSHPLSLHCMLDWQYTCCVCVWMCTSHTASLSLSENGVCFCSELIGCPYVLVCFVCVRVDVRMYVRACECTYVCPVLHCTPLKWGGTTPVHPCGYYWYRHKYVRLYVYCKYVRMLYCEPGIFRINHKKWNSPMICKFFMSKTLITHSRQCFYSSMCHDSVCINLFIEVRVCKHLVIVNRFNAGRGLL